MQNASCRYDRTIGDEFAEKLLPGNEYHFLIDTRSIQLADPYSLDVQLRENNTIMVYHGTTRIIKCRWSLREKRLCFTSAHKRSEACHGLFKVLTGLQGGGHEIEKTYGAFIKAVLESLRSGGRKGQYYNNQREGYWQNRLCIYFGGPDWTPDREWLIVDREVVVGFGNRSEKGSFYEGLCPHYYDIQMGLRDRNRNLWTKPNANKKPDELDMLAIDSKGKLLCIELKHGNNAAGIYWAPFQVGMYHEAYKRALTHVKEGVRKQINQKIDFGLLPPEALQRIAATIAGTEEPKSVLAVAEPKQDSGCWEQLRESMNAIRFWPDLVEVKKGPEPNAPPSIGPLPDFVK